MNSEWYRRAFPRTRIDPSKNTKTEFMTTQRDFRLSALAGGTLMRGGGDFIDDPIKPADAVSDSTPQRPIDWYGTTLLSRLDGNGRSRPRHAAASSWGSRRALIS
jgi:hypothetical protein